MAKCEFCNQEMLKSDGCDTAQLIMNDGDTCTRIAFGEEHDLFYGIADEDSRCHDCNAAFGEFHHAGCDSEICPKCYGQLISCDC